MPANSTIEESSAAALKRLEEKDRGLKRMLRRAYAYAVFPSVGKASLVVGGSYGRGAVFEQGEFIGHATISQFTIGVQVGGDTFTEILVFENKEALDRLKKGKMAFAANASAVLVKAGAAGTKNFTNGVAAYAYSSGGMLLEAAIGGQKFKFKAADEEEQDEQGQDEGEEQEKGGRGAKADKGKSAKGKASSSQEDEDEGEQDEEGQEDDDGQGEGEEEESGMLGRAMGGVRSALGGAAGGVKSAGSKIAETARAHPVAATVVGTALTAGVVLLVMRAVRGGSEQSEGDEDQDARSQSDEGEEQEDGGEGEEENDEKGDTLNQMRRRRSRA